MLKGASKTARTLALALLCAMAVTACGDSKEKVAAEGMLAQAGASMEAGRYDEALELLDSLPALYPAQTDARRRAMALRPQVIEKATAVELEQCDSLIADLTRQYSRSKEKLVYIDNPELVEGYWVSPAATKGVFMDGTGVQARVDSNGEFYMISEVNGAGNLHHSSITLSDDRGESVTSGTVPYDDELNYRLNGSETVTYSSAKCDSVGMFALAHRGAPLTVTFNGDKGGKRQVKLTAGQTDGIADAYEMAAAGRQGRVLMAKREMLDRKLQLAREQQKRLNKEEPVN